MGITNVAHVAGGFPALQKAGGLHEEVGCATFVIPMSFKVLAPSAERLPEAQ
jgi:hypothetical protein